jgi:hypothetical protein
LQEDRTWSDIDKRAAELARRIQRETEGEKPESYEFARTILQPIIKSALQAEREAAFENAAKYLGQYAGLITVASAP